MSSLHAGHGAFIHTHTFTYSYAHTHRATSRHVWWNVYRECARVERFLQNRDAFQSHRIKDSHYKNGAWFHLVFAVGVEQTVKGYWETSHALGQETVRISWGPNMCLPSDRVSFKQLDSRPPFNLFQRLDINPTTAPKLDDPAVID